MILGHERQIEYLNTVLRNGRLAHAYLFHGPEHVGKFTVAHELAKALWCEKARPSFTEQNLGGCDTCNSCKHIDAGEHPSVIVLDRKNTLVSKKEIRKEIPIGDIREVKRRLTFAATPTETRVIIINGAEYLSIEAANAFLKLLEEPGNQTLCILIAHDVDAVLPTIASRATHIRFSLLPPRELESYCRNNIRDATARGDSIRFANGRPGSMMRFLNEPHVLQEERNFLTAVEQAVHFGIPEAFLWSEKVSADEELRKKTIMFIVEVMRTRLSSNECDIRERRVITRRLKEIDRIATILATTNVNPRLAMDTVFLTCGNL